MSSYLKRRAKRGLKEAPGRTRYLSAEEEARLLDHATPAVRIAVALAIDTGLRREELFNLIWAQIDPIRGTITTTTRTKTGRARKVPLPYRSAQLSAQLPRRIDSPYVLVNPDTGQLSVTPTALSSGMGAGTTPQGKVWLPAPGAQVMTAQSVRPTARTVRGRSVIRRSSFLSRSVSTAHLSQLSHATTELQNCALGIGVLLHAPAISLLDRLNLTFQPWSASCGKQHALG